MRSRSIQDWICQLPELQPVRFPADPVALAVARALLAWRQDGSAASPRCLVEGMADSLGDQGIVTALDLLARATSQHELSTLVRALQGQMYRHFDKPPDRAAALAVACALGELRLALTEPERMGEASEIFRVRGQATQCAMSAYSLTTGRRMVDDLASADIDLSNRALAALEATVAHVLEQGPFALGPRRLSLQMRRAVADVCCYCQNPPVTPDQVRTLQVALGAITGRRQSAGLDTVCRAVLRAALNEAAASSRPN